MLCLQKRLPVIVDHHINMRPVVHPGTTHMVFRQTKAEGTDQVKLHAETNAKPAHRTGVVRNFGGNQHHAEITRQPVIYALVISHDHRR